MGRGTHLIGTTLGSCVLEKLLGYGGSSAVFLAQQQEPKRKVAIKVFLPRVDMDPKLQRDFYRRFLREAESASKLDHRNILHIYSYGEQNRMPYIIIPYMSGGTLSEYIAKNGALSLVEANGYLEQLASALDYAHSHGCIHCDVKPANILMDSDGGILLSDFGIARFTLSDDETLIARKTEVLMGTPDYISPEQALGRTIDERSDVYSLGITMFYLLANRLPFVADSMLALALLHVHETPPSLALIRADISPALDRVMHKALAKDPDKRFRTAGEFSIAFTQAIAVSAKIRSATVSGRRAAIRDANASSISSTSQPTLVALDPLVEVKAVRSTSFVSTLVRSRLMAFVVLLLLLLLGLGYTVNLISNQHAHGKTTNTLPTLVVVADPVHQDHLSNHSKWPRSRNFFYDAKMEKYHVLNDSPKNIALALYGENPFAMFSLTVTMMQVHASRENADYYGVVFRSTVDQSHYYLFEVITKVHANYVFLRFDKGHWRRLASGPAASLASGLGRNNTVRIDANGNTFTFFINNKIINKAVVDPTKSPLHSGLIGLYVEDWRSEVAFSHLYIASSH